MKSICLDPELSQKLRTARRIFVTGCSGSGKSTLTRYLADTLALPPIHYDLYFWRSGWLERSPEEWRGIAGELVSRREWIIDGSSPDTMDLSLPRAHLVVLIDLPRWLCIFRALWRLFKYNRIHRRPDLPQGCDETFNLDFYRYIWNYNRLALPRILDLTEQHSEPGRIVHLKSRREVRDFMAIAAAGQV